MNAREPAQLAVRCTPEGAVVEVLCDPQALLGTQPIGLPLRELVDRESAGKFELFLQSARQHGGAFGWELNVGIVGAPHAMSFAAMREDEGRLLVVATCGRATTLGLLDDAVRASAEGMIVAKQGDASSSWDPLDELARINNALVTLQRTLAKRNVELLQLTEQRNKLLGVLAHDLRGPVTIIRGYCELLHGQRHGLLTPLQRGSVDKIQRACGRLTELLENTLENARATAFQLNTKRTMADVVELVRDDVETHRSMASGKNIELSMVCLEPIPPTRIDPTGIHQVVSNLLSNAIKYSHANSEITVCIGRVDGELEITVQDRGQGIPSHELNLLFEPYGVTSVRPTAGETSTGLGLSIVRDVVEAHGGHVRVESTVNRGSTFFVRLPLVATSDCLPSLS